MRVRVDSERCQGHGVCVGESPEVFSLGADGELAVLIEKFPESLLAKLENAVRFCPTRAISIDE